MKKETNEQEPSVYRKVQTAALQLFSQKGYEKVSIDDLCQTAEITKPTFYNHIPSKKALFLSFYELDRDDLEFLNHPDNDPDPVSGIIQIYRFLFNVCTSFGREMFTTLLQISLTTPQVEMDLRDELRIPLLQRIAAGKEQGQIFQELSDTQILRMLNSFFYGYCYYFCNQQIGVGSLEELCEQLVTLLKTGGVSDEG